MLFDFDFGSSTQEPDKPQEEEVAQIIWVDVEKALDEITFEKSKQVLRDVLKDLN